MNLVDYKGLTSYLFRSELKSDLDKYILGAAWWIFEPFLFVSVWYFLFAHLKHGGDFVFSLICGIVTWRWLSEIINQGAASVSRKKAVLQNFRVHPFVFPVVSLMVSTFKFTIVLMCTIALLAWQDVLKLGGMLDALLLFFCALITAFSYGTFFSALTPFVPDVQIVISRTTMLAMFLSGVIFPISDMSETAQQVLFWNPFAHIVEGFRSILLFGEELNRSTIVTILVIHLPILGFSYLMLGHLRGEIPKRLI